MKFFTMAWWGGAQPGADSPYTTNEELFLAYDAYLNRFIDRIPAGLLAINQTVPLHDAKLRTLRYAQPAGTLTIEFDNYYEDSGEMRRFIVHYDDVSAFESVADPNVGLAGPGGYGDLGYDELDITPEGKAVHRLLFSTGIELHITCREARAWWV
jgi:hypothetical protein